MVGFGSNRRGGRLPSFILIALLVIIVILSYNYWSVSNKHGRLLDELAEAQSRVKRTDAARSRLEKRNSELMLQVDTHKKQIDQKDGDYSVLEGKLQARDALVKKCADEKMQLQADFTARVSEIQRLKEQLKELKQEFLRQEDQLREVKKNSSNLERKLEYESLQCGRQIAQLKEDYEESKKAMEEEAAKLRQSVLGGQKGGAAAGQAEDGTENEAAGEHNTVATHHRGVPDLKEDMGKPGSDAGMPGIEDSEVGKMDDVQFALKKPAITQQHAERGEAAAAKEDRGGMGAGAGAGEDGAHGLPLDQPDVPKGGGLGLAQGLPPQPQPQQQQQVPQPVADRPILFDEDNKAAIRADEFGEQHRKLRDSDGARLQGANLPPPPNPAQVLPNPIEQQHGKDQAPADMARHRQNDEDHEIPGDRGAEYGKRHQAIDIL
ncbi:protein CASC4 isoform X2 [Chanos chanos]|uniref:Protein GOLM2 n=1 Tax=Chanos chanos TaxID=29144 RepID=A0A6J2USW3_CHACN|nr:protein CASC4 isoform X2 [Chanos chanos]